MYQYEIEKPKILTDQGQRDFLKVRGKVKELLESAGAFKMFAPSGVLGSYETWYFMALIDRMVELKEIREITGPNICGQDRVFVAVR